MRKVILHYHFFKNAGTSLDAAFKDNFDENEWVTKEFIAQPSVNRKEVAQWILDNPEAKCFSSHTALLPAPKLNDVEVLPVVFFRHPIDRIVSAYAFETTQGGDGFGAVLARNTNLSGYLETRLSLPNDRQCRNFHAQRLATMYGEKEGSEYIRAKKAITKLPFVGVVEKFSSSLVFLESWLKSEGFDDIVLIPVEKNVSRGTRKPLFQKLAEIEKSIGKKVYTKLVKANRDDLRLYELLLKKITY